MRANVGVMKSRGKITKSKKGITFKQWQNRIHRLDNKMDKSLRDYHKKRAKIMAIEIKDY